MAAEFAYTIKLCGCCCWIEKYEFFDKGEMIEAKYTTNGGCCGGNAVRNVSSSVVEHRSLSISSSPSTR